MNKNIILIMSIGLATLASCTTVTKTAHVSEVEAKVYQYPTVADLEVMPKMEGTRSWNWRPIGNPDRNVEQGNLVAEMLKEKDADVLLEEQVIFTKTTLGKRELIVTGYPARLKNFRKATEQDLQALKVQQPACERKVYNVSQNIFKKVFGKKKAKKADRQIHIR